MQEELTMGPVCKQNGEVLKSLGLQSCNMELLSHQAECGHKDAVLGQRPNQAQALRHCLRAQIESQM